MLQKYNPISKIAMVLAVINFIFAIMRIQLIITGIDMNYYQGMTAVQLVIVGVIVALVPLVVILSMLAKNLKPALIAFAVLYIVNFALEGFNFIGIIPDLSDRVWNSEMSTLVATSVTLLAAYLVQAVVLILALCKKIKAIPATIITAIAQLVYAVILIDSLGAQPAQVIDTIVPALLIIAVFAQPLLYPEEKVK